MKVTPSSLHALPANHSTLSCLLDPATGGIVDDTVITRLGEEEFYFVTNAGRRDADLAFLAGEIDAFAARNGGEQQLTWRILSDSRALIALQGPRAAAALQPLLADPGQLSDLYFGQMRTLRVRLPSDTAADTATHEITASRTGYTGEDGFELSIPTRPDAGLPARLTEALLADPAVRLAGLAARDSLRLEAGMCLYGADITEQQTPPAASLGWLVGRDRRAGARADFNGAHAILPQMGVPPAPTLRERRVLLEIEGPGSAAWAGAQI
ncbi:Aminomethyltransferase, mitochondrial, partial [Ascosphaera acerosa]